MIRVNDFPPSSRTMTLFFKQVTTKKSDGAVAVCGQNVLVIDSGTEDDCGVLNYLLHLRETWLCEHTDFIEAEQAKLAVRLFITHAHADHIPAVFHLVRHPFFRIEAVYAPPRAALADIGSNEILTQSENQFILLQDELHRYGHESAQVRHLAFGEHRTISLDADCKMELFASPFDWSSGEGYDLVIKENVRFANPVAAECNGVLNNNSIWMKLTSNGQSFLHTGDQRDNELAVDHMMQFHGTDNFKCDVLKYIHHGEGRYSQYLSDVTRPAVTIFTGLEKHIRPEALAAAKHYGTACCADGGDVILRLDGKSIFIQ